MLTETQKAIAISRKIARESGAPEVLDELLRNSGRSNRGATALTSIQFLFLQHLTVRLKGSALVRDLVKVCNDLPYTVKKEFNLPPWMTETHIYNYTRKLRDASDYTPARTPDLTDEERETRHDILNKYVLTYLTYTMFIDPENQETFSLDETAVIPLERGTMKKNEEGVVMRPQVGRGAKGPSDCMYGTKTDTNGSGTQIKYWGYSAHTFTTIPVTESGPDRVQTPFFLLTPGNANVTESTFTAVDIVREKYGIKTIIADRLYSSLAYDQWFEELLDRGMQQVVDLTKTQQGFKDFDGMKIAASWPHCPATPPEHGTIPTLGMLPSLDQSNRFTKRIENRFAFAMDRKETVTGGGIRYVCPAITGKVGCPIRGENNVQVSRENGLPIITNPPAGETLPPSCNPKDASFTLRAETVQQKVALKLRQEHYWGSKMWQKMYRKRGSIERLFGHAKQNQALEAKTFAYIGIGMATIAVTTIFAEVNIRKLECWAEVQNTLPEHPMLIDVELNARKRRKIAS